MKKFFFLVLLFSCHVISAQNYTQFWVKTTLQYNISSKLSSSLELHHRTQGSLNTESPFRYPLTSAVRLWLVYKLSDHESINLSPYAFFSNHPQVKKEQDLFNSNANEHRVHVQYENKLPVGKVWSLISRFDAEYRIFEGNQDLFRVRFREAISYYLSKNISIQVYDELFLNTINVDKRHVFDQNRIGLVSNFSLSDNLRLELGTVHIQSLPRNSPNVMNTFMLQTNLIYFL